MMKFKMKMKWNYRRKKMKKVQIFICDEEIEVSDEDVIEELFYPLDLGDE